MMHFLRNILLASFFCGGLLLGCSSTSTEAHQDDLSSELPAKPGSDALGPGLAESPAERPGSACADIGQADLQSEMLRQVNALREAGCKCGEQLFPPTHALRWNTQLQAAAERHSRDMAAQQQMAHEGSDGSSMAERVKDAGYHYGAIAENVAWNQRSISQVVESWKNSPGHCRNMMGAQYTEMAAAVDDCYWTQVFGAILQ